ncbi:MAG: RNA-dependent ATPase rok1 [Trichoglossum hirsutum]|nr:MAG: RNA-dependent ATPase rok1 [Trichoglossum hirsutum]
MDIFKLLSRSTNIKNAAIASSVSPSTLPSGGARPNPQLFGNDGEDLHRPKQEARKRKRGEPATKSSDSIPEELDFFGDKSAKKPEDAVSRCQPCSSDIAVGETERSGSSASDIEILDEEECQRILRSHKLKITLLSSIEKQKRGRRVDATDMSTNNKKTHTQLFPQPLTSFDQLQSRYKIVGRLLQNVRDQGYNLPTEVQLGSLPLLLESNEAESVGFKRALKRGDGVKGRRTKAQAGMDLLTVAPTGSGKTLSYLIPVLDGLLRERGMPNDSGRDMGRGVRAIIIAPTKELANQILNEARKLAVGTGIKVTRMRKGMVITQATDTDGNSDSGCHHGHGLEGDAGDETDGSDDDEFERTGIKKRKTCGGQLVKAQVLVSTPLMLLHAVTDDDSGSISTLHLVRYLVLDEADVLLDPLFRSQTLGIWGACKNPHLRVSLWSATMGSSIEALAQSTILTRRQSLSLPATKLVRLVVGLKDSAIPNISHRLTYAATEQGKLLALRQLLHPTASTDSTPSLRPPFLVFTQTIPRAVALHSELLYDIPAEAGGSSRIAVLHSDLSETQRDRIMARFREGEIWVLITTDLLARGIDFRGVNGVVNYDVPNSGAAYIHRVGRTGRAGRDGGVAVTLYTKEDIPYVKNVANIIATSEKLSGRSNDGKGDLQKWLLDMLPTPTKNDKKRLKRHGVEERRASMAVKDAKTARKMRISTKSGFDRRIEHNRSGAMHRRRQSTSDRDDRLAIHSVDGEDYSESEWGGFDN